MTLNKLRIVTLIAEQQTTQASLAQKCGLSRQSLNTILRRGTCEIRTAGKLAVGLGVNVEDILREER